MLVVCDYMSKPVPASTESKIHRYPCPGCSADLIFKPEEGCLTCPYCGRREQIPATAEQVVELSYEDYLQLKPEQMKPMASDALEVHCAGCGALVTFRP